MVSIQLLSSLFVTFVLACASQRPCIDTTGMPDWYKRNLNTIQQIYNLTVYPHNEKIVEVGASAVPDHLFSKNATGRVSPVGNFSSFEDSIEYFFALAPTPKTSAGVGFYAADVVAYTSGCPDVATSVVYLRSAIVSENATIDYSKPRTTLSQVAFWKFDDTGAVEFYQAWIPNLQKWTETATGLNYSNSIIQTAAENLLCQTIEERCTGKDLQYGNASECANTLATKPFGDFDEVWGDNVVCRIIHVLLTKVRPDVHCPHVGPFGGSPPNDYKCTNINYTADYFDDTALFGTANRFTCKDNPWEDQSKHYTIRDLMPH